MSRSTPKLEKPANKYFEYKAEKGILQYYDKATETTYPVPLPFSFLVLDELNTITGYSKPHKASHYSNEVRNSLKEPFTIMLKGQQVFHGLYKNEQKVVQVPRSAAYTKSIYIAYKDGANWAIGNIKLAGSGMSAWIDFTSSHKNVQDEGKVIMTKGAKVEGEKSDYYPPAFEFVKANKEEDDIAVELDKKLQAYLTQYFIAQGTPDEDAVPSEGDMHTTTDDRRDIIEGSPSRRTNKPLSADDFPDDFPDDDTQKTYNRQAVNEVFGDGEDPGFTDADIPPELR